MTKPNIAVIIGSTRATRFADKPAAWLMENVQTRSDMDFELLDLRDYDLPLFDEIASNLWVPSQDPRVVKWQQKLAEFDGYIFLTAEYNHSLTGSLKNALDQAYKEWNRKPAAAMASAVFPIPGTPTSLGASGRSFSSTTNQQASNCFSTSCWPIHSALFSIGVAKRNRTP